ncbi:MAG: helix-turn-helix domain-containing protein [Lachnospiraceae bacterium]|nr:helix-turn-helix domain-containing protein [Lachnospiraceae bacterium]
MEFGELLKKTRLKYNITISELSQKVSVSEKMLKKYENNTALPDIETLMEICNILKVTPNDLLIDVTFSGDYSDNDAAYLDKIKDLCPKERLELIRRLKEEGCKVTKDLLECRWGICNYHDINKIVEIMKAEEYKK